MVQFSDGCRYWADGSGQRAHRQRCTRVPAIGQHSASNPASRSLALSVVAIRASGVYLRRCGVGGRSRLGRVAGGEVFARQKSQVRSLSRPPARHRARNIGGAACRRIGRWLLVVARALWVRGCQLVRHTRHSDPGSVRGSPWTSRKSAGATLGEDAGAGLAQQPSAVPDRRAHVPGPAHAGLAQQPGVSSATSSSRGVGSAGRSIQWAPPGRVRWRWASTMPATAVVPPASTTSTPGPRSADRWHGPPAEWCSAPGGYRRRLGRWSTPQAVGWQGRTVHAWVG
jgi:hypothetical protein